VDQSLKRQDRPRSEEPESFDSLRSGQLESILATPELEGEIAPAEVVALESPARPALLTPGMRYMIAAALAFSVMSLMVRYAGQWLPSQEMVVARAVFSLVVTGLYLYRAKISPWGNNRRLLLARGIIGYAGLAAFYYALVHMPLAEATVIQYTNPVFAAVLAVWLLGERMRRREVVLVLLSIAGVLLISKPSFIFGGHSNLKPLVVAIGMIGAIGSGTAYVLVRKLSATEHVMVIVFYFSMASTVCAIPMAIPGAVWPSAIGWLLLLGIAITTQIAQVSLTHGLKLERAGKATAIAYTQIVFAALWGALFFHEVPHWNTIAGTVLIVGATLALGRTSS
jgi:drug/metabolite transporter (DMT)-like permease